MAGVFDLELHDEENIRDSDDDVIEVDDVSRLALPTWYITPSAMRTFAVSFCICVLFQDTFFFDQADSKVKTNGTSFVLKNTTWASEGYWHFSVVLFIIYIG